MSGGFTLLEVVVSLLILEVAVIAAAGTLVVASRSLGEAEHLERAVLEAEGVLDSLAGAPSAASGSRGYPGGYVEWTVDGQGEVVLRVRSAEDEVRLEVLSAVRAP
jgi:Tfp pilus assembly protein PilV